MARDSILKVNNYFDDLDDMCVLELEGAIDAYTVFYLRERFEDLYERNCYRVLVDCQLVTYISSSGIELFLTVLETIQENKGTFVLTNLAEKVIEVFNLLGLTNIFSIIINLESIYLSIKLHIFTSTSNNYIYNYRD